LASKTVRKCDGCGTAIPPNRIYLNVDYKPNFWSIADRTPIEVELMELFREQKEFCDLHCIQRWLAVTLNPTPTP
jgi:hypothetical protein